MKNRIIMVVVCFCALLTGGCSDTKKTEISVVATTDLHGQVPYDVVSYVEKERKKDKNITVVDAGDFYDVGMIGSSMYEYRNTVMENYENNVDEYVEVPIARDMKEVGYDAVVLGNHEFVGNDKKGLDGLISDFKKQGIEVLSANTYNKDGSSYTKPYIIKNIKTPEGVIKLGVLGLTIKEVGEEKTLNDKGELVKSKSLELKDKIQYEGLYMTDLVEDAKKWVEVMKQKDKVDVIVAVAHTGEAPEKPKHPGNRIQDLARQVSGIDAIVAGHNHVEIEQHDYKNKDGKNVIVTEPGSFGECVSDINFKMEKKNDKWVVEDKSSKLIKFDENKEEDNYEDFMAMLDKKGMSGEEVTLSKDIPFEWDKIYVYKVGTPYKDVIESIGYKWRNIDTQDRKDSFKMAIMNDGKVATYIYFSEGESIFEVELDENEYDKNVATIYPSKNDKFKVETIRQGGSIKLKQIN